MPNVTHEQITSLVNLQKIEIQIDAVTRYIKPKLETAADGLRGLRDKLRDRDRDADESEGE